MIKYTPATIAKALVAFAAAFMGAIATASGGVDFGDLNATQWVLALGAGLTAGAGVFATPNKSTPGAIDIALSQIDKAAKSVAKAESQIAATSVAAPVGVVVQEAKDALGGLVDRVEGLAANVPPPSIVDELINRVRLGL